jgi:hypothetical protein
MAAGRWRSGNHDKGVNAPKVLQFVSVIQSVEPQLDMTCNCRGTACILCAGPADREGEIEGRPDPTAVG